MQRLLEMCSQALQEQDPQKLRLLANRINERAYLINERMTIVVSAVHEVKTHVEKVVMHRAFFGHAHA